MLTDATLLPLVLRARAIPSTAPVYNTCSTKIVSGFPCLFSLKCSVAKKRKDTPFDVLDSTTDILNKITASIPLLYVLYNA